MLSRRQASLLLTLSLAPALACAADTLSLAQARTEAADHSPQLKRLDALADGAAWQRRLALASGLPQLGLKANHLFDAEYGVLDVVFGGSQIAFPEAFPQDTLDLDAQWTLFDGFRTWKGWQAAGLEEQAARNERSHGAFSLGQEVAIRYVRAVAALQLQGVAAQNIATLEDHLNLAQASEDSGDATHFDVLRIQAQLEEARANAQLAQDQVTNSRQDLAQAMGLSQDARSLDPALPQPDAAQVPEGLGLDLGQRQDLNAQAQRLQALDERSDAAEAGWYPQIYLFGQRQYYHFGEFDPAILPTEGDYKALYSFGVGASWALYNGGGEQAEHRLREAQAEAARQALEAARLAAGRDFDAALRRFHYSVRLYQARQRSVELSQESVRLAQLGFKTGARTSSEVLDAELDLFRARAGLVQAQADAAEAKLKLELLRGKAL